MAKRKSRLRTARDWLTDRVVRAAIFVLMRLPYETRIPAAGRLARMIAPFAGYRARIRDNLALVLPEMPADQVRRVQSEVPDTMGRVLIELYSGPEFAARAATLPFQGPGLAALDEAHAAGRPVLLVTGHFGNYDAARAALLARGFRVGGLYRPMNNRFFNPHYVQAMESVGKPVFPRGRAGLSDMLRFLRRGGMLGIVIDQYQKKGAVLSFMGRPAVTALSAAELALRYDALVIPTYGRRRPDGIGFDILLEAPIPHTTAEAMTQALNDSLSARVLADPGQWLWTHRRWKLRKSHRARVDVPPG